MSFSVDIKENDLLCKELVEVMRERDLAKAQLTWFVGLTSALDLLVEVSGYTGATLDAAETIVDYVKANPRP